MLSPVITLRHNICQILMVLACFFYYFLDIKTKDRKNIKQWQSNKRTEHHNLSNFHQKLRHALSYKLTSIWTCKRLSISINKCSVVSSLATIIYKGKEILTRNARSWKPYQPDNIYSTRIIWLQVTTYKWKFIKGKSNRPVNVRS